MAQLGFLDRMEITARLSVPYAFMALLLILSLISVPYPLALVFDAPLLLIVLFYWSVFRPTLVPPPLVFCAGLVFDLLAGMPLPGLTAILLLVVRLGVVDQRRYLMGQGFVLIWLGYGGISLFYIFSQWAVLSVSHFQILPYQDFATTYFAGLLIFPLIYVLIHITHKFLPSTKEHLHAR